MNIDEESHYFSSPFIAVENTNADPRSSSESFSFADSPRTGRVVSCSSYQEENSTRTGNRQSLEESLENLPGSVDVEDPLNVSRYGKDGNLVVQLKWDALSCDGTSSLGCPESIDCTYIIEMIKKSTSRRQ